MEDRLHERVIGQDEAVAAVSDAVRRARAGLKDPKPPDRLVPLPRPDRRRQDRAGAGAGRVPVRRRERAWSGSTCASTWRSTPSARLVGAPARLRRLRGGRPADRGGPPPAVPGGAARRDREGAPGRVQRPAAGPRRRPPDRRRRAAPSTSRTPSIIMTSNIGSAGAHRAGERGDAAFDEAMRRGSRDQLRAHFRPEFLNRIDEVIVFRPLDEAQLRGSSACSSPGLGGESRRPAWRSRSPSGPRPARPRGLRPGLRRPSAQAHDPARAREPARAPDARRGVPAGHDGGRRRGRWDAELQRRVGGGPDAARAAHAGRLDDGELSA